MSSCRSRSAAQHPEACLLVAEGLKLQESAALRRAAAREVRRARVLAWPHDRGRVHDHRVRAPLPVPLLWLPVLAATGSRVAPAVAPIGATVGVNLRWGGAVPSGAAPGIRRSRRPLPPPPHLGLNGVQVQAAAENESAWQLSLQEFSQAFRCALRQSDLWNCSLETNRAGGSDWRRSWVNGSSEPLVRSWQKPS